MHETRRRLLKLAVVYLVAGLVAVAIADLCREEERRRSEAEAACPCGSKACPGRATVVLPRGR